MPRASFLPLLATLAVLSAPVAAQQAGPAPVAIAPGAPSIAWSACPPIFPTGCEMTVLHGDPAQPNADVMLRVQPGTQLAAHTHSSAERMILTAGRMTVKYDGAPEITLEPGSYAYGPADLPHRAACVGDEPCVLFIAFEGPVDANPHVGELR